MCLSTANGHIQVTLWIYVRIHELDILVPALLLRDAPSLLSMGMLWKVNGYKFEWDPDEGPSLQKKGEDPIQLEEVSNAPSIKAARINPNTDRCQFKITTETDKSPPSIPHAADLSSSLWDLVSAV